MTDSSQPDYTITLDDDGLVPKIIEQITELPTRAYVEPNQLVKDAHTLRPLAAFVDINLGQESSGLDIIPKLRSEWPDIPIIVITGENDDATVGQSLAVGANDFVRKPIRPRELMARLQARVSEMKQRAKTDIVGVGDASLNTRQRTLQLGNHRCFLSPVETDLLHTLVDARGTVVTKADLKRKLWGDIKVSDNALDRRISALRKALKEVGENTRIESVYGEGVRIKKSANG
jgi:DNA-binding response OmpR family regulator